MKSAEALICRRATQGGRNSSGGQRRSVQAGPGMKSPSKPSCQRTTRCKRQELEHWCRHLLQRMSCACDSGRFVTLFGLNDHHVCSTSSYITSDEVWPTTHQSTSTQLENQLLSVHPARGPHHRATNNKKYNNNNKAVAVVVIRTSRMGSATIITLRRLDRKSLYRFVGLNLRPWVCSWQQARTQALGCDCRLWVQFC